MNYCSTRTELPPVSAARALLNGLAPDGGLYVPEVVPGYVPTKRMTYNELAVDILSLFFGEFGRGVVETRVAAAYGDGGGVGGGGGFPAKVVRAGEWGFLELYHGKTAAFKDAALSILPSLMGLAKAALGDSAETLILTATSGDTGGAALAGFGGIEGFKAMTFFPEVGVSEVQRLQMTANPAANVTAAALRGNFDDAQTKVKGIFGDRELAERLASRGVELSSANSINVGRLVPQIVYYYYACQEFSANGGAVDFCVPTGNFGNILAAWYAKKMGANVGNLVCASNANNVLADFFKTGEYDANRDFFVTQSPSMDILRSSNLERLLYYLGGENRADLRLLMGDLREKSAFSFGLPREGFSGEWASEDECAAAVKEAFEEHGYLMDTHTAVAYVCAKKAGARRADKNPMVIVSTADPFKFAPAVLRTITGERLEGFEAVRRLEAVTGRTAPASISSLEGARVLHDNLIEPSEAAAFVEDFALNG